MLIHKNPRILNMFRFVDRNQRNHFLRYDCLCNFENNIDQFPFQIRLRLRSNHNPYCSLKMEMLSNSYLKQQRENFKYIGMIM